MKALWIPVLASALGAVTLVPAGAAPADTASAPTVQVQGEKLDSGLGDLPHYRDWKDPTGKAPLGK
ncbi:hypothetical protein HZ992_22540 [Rhizobacter sp. AJA081-3]|jgi:hypothetical protein|uniref:hypothetical protein n=1 Tax=Rhizobacter sp. AJA081-3 TaxID=2753607 RepID=UPI001AE031BA|nr:hypothetical protein [Rhizobacter sp. AJA081-3]QTN22866.1 hypothetical protein HZ992_22540 [Rhizobacter sp. AJA081-3]